MGHIKGLIISDYFNLRTYIFGFFSRFSSFELPGSEQELEQEQEHVSLTSIMITCSLVTTYKREVLDELCGDCIPQLGALCVGLWHWNDASHTDASIVVISRS